MLTNVAFYTGVSPEELLESPAVAVTFANRFYGVMAWIMPILVACSCFGTVNGVMLTSSRCQLQYDYDHIYHLRLFFVAGRQQHMPWVLSFINPDRETPIPAVLFTVKYSVLSYICIYTVDFTQVQLKSCLRKDRNIPYIQSHFRFEFERRVDVT